MSNIGFGFVNKTLSGKFAIKVADTLDYEISFWFRQPNLTSGFEVSVRTFTCNLLTELKTIDIRNGGYNNTLLPGTAHTSGKVNQWNFWHGIVYNKNQPIINDRPPLTSHAVGTNLIMAAGTEKLFVNVFATKNCLLIWDFKVKPASTPFATGFLGADGLLEIFRKNRRRDLNTQQVNGIAEKFLLPYNSSTAVIEL